MQIRLEKIDSIILNDANCQIEIVVFPKRLFLCCELLIGLMSDTTPKTQLSVKKYYQSKLLEY